jgi:hypothetical protein
MVMIDPALSRSGSDKRLEYHFLDLGRENRYKGVGCWKASRSQVLLQNLTPFRPANKSPPNAQ